MRINILSLGRFHVLDLARELHRLGHQVRFYSYVPKARTRKFGLLDECARSVFLWMAIPWLIRRLFPTGGLFDYFFRSFMDMVVKTKLEPCDVVIAMSRCFNRSVLHARSKFGAKVLIECGSRHILSQKEIADSIRRRSPEAHIIADYDVRSDIKDYRDADYVVVPSKHVVESFVERGFPRKKLFRNPYGVNIQMFGPTENPQSKPTVVMTGNWSYIKGVDLLWEAIKGTDYQLIHAGPHSDCPYPNSERFKNFGKVDETRLNEIYAMAHVMVLPSRQDGFGMVLSQALACGLCLVCSDRTGGADLKQFIKSKRQITVVRADDVTALRKGIARAMKYALARRGLRKLSDKEREKLSWQAYGKRYDSFLKRFEKG